MTPLMLTHIGPLARLLDYHLTLAAGCASDLYISILAVVGITRGFVAIPFPV